MIRLIRLLHLVAIVGLIGSAAYAYSIKYETLYQGEQVAKLNAALRRERDAIAVLKAEWQLMTRPDRMQAAVERHLDLEPVGVQHLARLSELPPRAARGDEIGRKLEMLGLGGATPKEPAPQARAADGARTPAPPTRSAAATTR